MTFAAPAWLLLAPALALLAWQAPGLGLRRPLRVLLLALLVLTLADPQARRYAPGMDLWVLVDRSDSAADLLEPRLGEWERLLKQRKGTQDRLFFIDFGLDALVRSPEPGAVSEVRTGQTRVAEALRLAATRRDPDRATRLLLLTDGQPSDSLDGLPELLSRAELPLDIRLTLPPSLGDYQAEPPRVPDRVQVGEPFVLEVRVHGKPDAAVPYQVLRDGELLAQGSVNLSNGFGRARISDRLSRAGAARYTVQILPEKDPRPGNNQSEAWVNATAGARILLLSAYGDDPVATALRIQGFDVELQQMPAVLHPGRLAGAQAVILNNVPAAQLPEAFFDALEFYVREQGGGLLMLGGKHSFGLGGYHGSHLGELLPISMELRQEDRKLAVALAVVLDRSGSMAASVGGATKMDLANTGAAETVRLLGPMDAVSVIAVDSEPDVVAPLMPVKSAREEIIHRILRIKSTGGGIFVYTGLLAAAQELSKAQAGQKHIILFADAADAEEPGNYIKLLDKLTAGGVTVSVIGLGTENDVDADFLKDVAKRGEGRIYFTNDAARLPALFTQEVTTVARAAFVDEPTALKPSAAWLELAARPLEWPASVSGYNLAYLQPQAAQAAVSMDDNEAPLVAFWQRGAGRAAAVTFPLSGPFSETARAWPGYGDFTATLARWLMGESTPPGLTIRSALADDHLVLDLYYDDSWESRLLDHFPQAIVTTQGWEKRQSLEWEQIEPGHFRATWSLDPGALILGAVHAGNFTLPFGPVTVGSELEWRRQPEAPRKLKALSRVTGGIELVNLADAWREPPLSRPRSLRAYFFLALLIALLAEATVTRLGLLTRWRRANK